MASILPQSISKHPHISALEEGFADKLAALDVGAALLYLTEIVAESALDTLIAQWGLSGHGVEFSYLTVTQKRELVRQAALVNQRRGTIWVLRYMFAAAGMPEIHVAEAAELNVRRYYNGVWHYNGVIPYGFMWLWAQYAVVIYADVMTVAMTDALLAAMDRMLLEFAPARCAHIGFTARVRMDDELGLTDELTIIETP